MKQVIGELVSANQSVSLSGRNISDCTLLAIVERFKKKGGAKACIKVNLHKHLIALIGILCSPL